MLGDKPVADALASPKSSLRSKLEYAADVSCDFLVCSTHEKSFKARRRSRQRVVDGKPVASRGDVFAAFRIFSEKTEKTRCSLRSRSERRAVGTRSGASTRDGPGRGGGRAATRERRGSARAEEFRRCRTSRSDDGCAALTGGTAASSKLNSRSPADAVLEGTKRSEYTVSLFPLDPGGFVSGADIVYDARARTEARSGRAEHVGTPRLPAVANSEEAPYPTFRRFPCVSAPHASPRRSRARRCRARFASRCPIRARVPTTSRASRCGPLRASSLVGTVSSGQNLVVADLEMHKGSVCLALAVFPAPSLKNR